MPKYLVLFLVPPAVIDDWQKTDPDIRKPAEDKMRAEWGAWMGAHGASVSGMEAAGKTKRVAVNGVADTRNDVMLHCFAEAASHEEAAKLFEHHPHLTIPQSSIEITETRPMAG